MRILDKSLQASRALQLISPRIGVMKSIGRAHLQNQDPKIMAYTAFNPDTSFLGGDPYSGMSGGCGFEWMDAYLAAVGEGVERYSSTFYDPKKLTLGSYRDLPLKNMVHPSDFALFHEEQYKQESFPFIPFTEDSIVYWERMRNLITGEEAHLPATFVYLPFTMQQDPISEQISTGLAAHVTYPQAMLNAIYEVIERDSFSITWMNMLQVEKIQVTGELQKLIEERVPKNYRIHLMNMTTDLGVPSVFGILEGEQDFGDFIATSAATRSTFGEAIKKTILELCQSVPYYRYLLDENRDKNFADFSELKTFQDHSLLYTTQPQMRGVFQHWLDQKPTKLVDFDHTEVAPSEKLRRILRAFKKLDYQVYFKDITTQDVRKAGYVVVRMTCPQTIHLNGTYGQYYLGGKRLYETPERLGHPRRTFATLNPNPHPFP